MHEVAAKRFWKVKVLYQAPTSRQVLVDHDDVSKPLAILPQVSGMTPVLRGQPRLEVPREVQLLQQVPLSHPEQVPLSHPGTATTTERQRMQDLVSVPMLPIAFFAGQ